MIGDNPRADVRGANLAGDPWRSILVCTGELVAEGTEGTEGVSFPQFSAVFLRGKKFHFGSQCGDHFH